MQGEKGQNKEIQSKVKTTGLKVFGDKRVKTRVSDLAHGGRVLAVADGVHLL